MTIDTEYLIKISRATNIEDRINLAIIRLDSINHYFGQPVMIRYYEDPEKTKINCIFAIGIKDGIGKDCYKIISIKGIKYVRNVVEQIPDVSALTHNEIYLWKNDIDEKWSYVYLEGDSRTVTPIEEDKEYIFTNIENGFNYYYSKNILKREDDFYTKEEIDKLINDLNISEVNEKISKIEEKINTIDDDLEIIKKDLYPLSIYLEIKNSSIPLKGIPTTLKIKVLVEENKTDVTKSCIIKVNEKITSIDNDNIISISNILDTTDLKITAEYNNKSVEDTKTIYFGEYVYLSKVSKDWQVSEENITSLEKEITIKNLNLIKKEFNLNNETIVIAYPKEFGNLTYIYDDNNLNYLYDYEIINDDIQINGVDYIVYKKLDSVTINNFKQEFFI